MYDPELSPKGRALDLLKAAFEASRLKGELKSPTLPRFSIQEPPKKEYGDLATNIALVLSAAEKDSPRRVAELLIKNLPDCGDVFSEVSVAGPGFINLRFSRSFWRAVLRSLTGLQAGGLIPNVGEGRRAVVEYVSANPTGPLHVGHGRGAAVGDAIARILASTGYQVTRQYYLNDAGHQVEALGRSLLFRLHELRGRRSEPPEDFYSGEYLIEIAQRLDGSLGHKVPEQNADDLARHLQQEAMSWIMEEIKRDLADFRVHFDEFVSELELVKQGLVNQAIETLRSKEFLFEENGALWFRSKDFDDQKDRPVVKADGSFTYLATDIALHHMKFERGFDDVINIWGADHHGYVARVKGTMKALGHPAEKLRVVLVQMVNLVRGGVPVRMGKRSGEFVTLREVLDEVGVDAARFFFLMRKSDTQLEFDLDLAKKQSAENPVFYVQYAHSRITSILGQAESRGVSLRNPENVNLEHLDLKEECELMEIAARFPEVVAGAAAELEPHRVAFYLIELAGEFHRYYNRHQVLGSDVEVTQARLLLIRVIREVIATGLNLLGVSAPHRM